jgi:hypothetical protein
MNCKLTGKCNKKNYDSLYHIADSQKDIDLYELTQKKHYRSMSYVKSPGSLILHYNPWKYSDLYNRLKEEAEMKHDDLPNYKGTIETSDDYTIPLAQIKEAKLVQEKLKEVEKGFEDFQDIKLFRYLYDVRYCIEAAKTKNLNITDALSVNFTSLAITVTDENLLEVYTTSYFRTAFSFFKKIFSYITSFFSSKIQRKLVTNLTSKTINFSDKDDYVFINDSFTNKYSHIIYKYEPIRTVKDVMIYCGMNPNNKDNTKLFEKYFNFNNDKISFKFDNFTYTTPEYKKSPSIWEVFLYNYDSTNLKYIYALKYYIHSITDGTGSANKLRIIDENFKGNDVDIVLISIIFKVNVLKIYIDDNDDLMFTKLILSTSSDPKKEIKGKGGPYTFLVLQDKNNNFMMFNKSIIFMDSLKTLTDIDSQFIKAVNTLVSDRTLSNLELAINGDRLYFKTTQLLFSNFLHNEFSNILGLIPQFSLDTLSTEDYQTNFRNFYNIDRNYNKRVSSIYYYFPSGEFDGTYTFSVKSAPFTSDDKISPRLVFLLLYEYIHYVRFNKEPNDNDKYLHQSIFQEFYYYKYKNTTEEDYNKGEFYMRILNAFSEYYLVCLCVFDSSLDKYNKYVLQKIFLINPQFSSFVNVFINDNISLSVPNYSKPDFTEISDETVNKILASNFSEIQLNNINIAFNKLNLFSNDIIEQLFTQIQPDSNYITDFFKSLEGLGMYNTLMNDELESLINNPGEYDWENFKIKDEDGEELDSSYNNILKAIMQTHDEYSSQLTLMEYTLSSIFFFNVIACIKAHLKITDDKYSATKFFKTFQDLVFHKMKLKIFKGEKFLTQIALKLSEIFNTTLVIIGHTTDNQVQQIYSPTKIRNPTNFSVVLIYYNVNTFEMTYLRPKYIELATEFEKTNQMLFENLFITKLDDILADIIRRTVYLSIKRTNKDYVEQASVYLEDNYRFNSFEKKDNLYENALAKVIKEMKFNFLDPDKFIRLNKVGFSVLAFNLFLQKVSPSSVINCTYEQAILFLLPYDNIGKLDIITWLDIHYPEDIKPNNLKNPNYVITYLDFLVFCRYYNIRLVFLNESVWEVSDTKFNYEEKIYNLKKVNIKADKVFNVVTLEEKEYAANNIMFSNFITHYIDKIFSPDYFLFNQSYVNSRYPKLYDEFFYKDSRNFFSKYTENTISKKQKTNYVGSLLLYLIHNKKDDNLTLVFSVEDIIGESLMNKNKMNEIYTNNFKSNTAFLPTNFYATKYDHTKSGPFVKSYYMTDWEILFDEVNPANPNFSFDLFVRRYKEIIKPNLPYFLDIYNVESNDLLQMNPELYDYFLSFIGTLIIKKSIINKK